MSVHPARQAIARAKAQLGRVQSAAWDPPDPEAAVTWAFYAYENAVVAAAEAAGLAWAKNHYRKAELAEDLVVQGILQSDVKERLLELNDLRKDVAYGEPGAALAGQDLEDLASELEDFIDEVENVLVGRGL